MPGINVLICGAGIAGPTLALLLSRSSQIHNITIVERSPSLRTTGQQIDLRLSGITIMRRLGLLEELKGLTVEETGLAIVDRDDNVKAAFPVGNGSESQSFSSEFEILRGKFAELLYHKTKDLPNIQYIFGDRVERLQHKDNEVHVEFAHGTPSACFTLVVAADGMHSRTREVAWAQSTSKSSPNLVQHGQSHSRLKSLNQYTAYFSMPISESDLKAAGTGMGRWYNAPGRRCIFLRPDHRSKKQCSAYLSIMVSTSTSGHSKHSSGSTPVIGSAHDSIRRRLETAVKNHTDINSQKALFRDLFADSGWEVDRVLKGMDDSDDFYMQEVAQVQLSPAVEPPHRAWSRERVVCLGDAGYCPSPITGMGTTVAIVGAYVLAGEIARAAASESDDAVDKLTMENALANYEQIFRPYAENAQKLPPGAPAIANPETAWGIWIFHGILGFVSKTGLASLMGKLSASLSKETFELPLYKELCLDD